MANDEEGIGMLSFGNFAPKDKLRGIMDAKISKKLSEQSITYEEWSSVMLYYSMDVISLSTCLSAIECLKIESIKNQEQRYEYLFYFTLTLKHKDYEVARAIIKQPGFNALFFQNSSTIEIHERAFEMLAKQMTASEIDILDDLLNTGIDINSDKHVLFTAVANRNYYALQAFIERGANIFTKRYDRQRLCYETLWYGALDFTNNRYKRVVQYVDNNIKQRLNLQQLCWLAIRANAIEFNTLPQYIITDCKTSLAVDFSEIDEEHMDECAPPLLKSVYTLAQESKRQKKRSKSSNKD